MGTVIDVPQSLIASKDDAAVDDEPTLELISAELELGDLDGAFTELLFDAFADGLGVGLTQRSGCALTYALKFGSVLRSGSFQGKRLRIMHRKIMATLQTSVLRGS